MRRKIALIGDPVEHSLSPRMHAAGFAAVGVDAEYVAHRVAPGDPVAVEEAMRGFAAGNVTIPHKEAAAAALDEATDAVRKTGACNCFWTTFERRLAGDNTDVQAIMDVLREMLARREVGSVLVLGAGGGAAAAAVAAGRLSADSVRICGRSPERVAALVARLSAAAVPASAADWPASGLCNIVINATPLGMSDDDALPASFDDLTARFALDLVYRSGADGTAWTRDAARRGIVAADGLEVLARQGAACYPRWFGAEPPLGVLRQSLASAE